MLDARRAAVAGVARLGPRPRRAPASPEDELCGEVRGAARRWSPEEHVRYLDCVFEKDWVYAFDAIRPVPQHRLVGLKVKTSSGKKHRLRIASSPTCRSGASAARSWGA